MFGNAKEIQELRESFAHMGAMVEELKSQSAFFKSKISSLNSQIAAMSEKVESLEALLAQKADKPASSAETMTAQQPARWQGANVCTMAAILLARHSS